MKRIALTLIVAAGAFAVMGCSSGPTDRLRTSSEISRDPNSPAGGADNTFNHDFSNPNAEQAITGGSNADDTGPVSGARYHGCTKITYAALGSILTSRGAKATGNTNALTIYKNSAAALGIANYSGRVPEALIASTSAIAKEFDIFVAAAPEIQANLSGTTACQGVNIADAQGQFSKDGLSCIMGTPATDEHVAVANQAVADAVKGGAQVAQGIQLAIAAALEAAHTCE
jgi:hypothetical protein